MAAQDPPDDRGARDPDRPPEDESTVAEAEGRDLDRPLSSGTLPTAVPCPFCESTDTSQFAVFGGQASTSQYYCNGCRTVFEYFRWR